MAKAVPIHVLILDTLENSVSGRITDHQDKCGNGLDEKPYQRMVGRIAEGNALLKEIADLRKRLQTDDDLDEGDNSRVTTRKRR